MTGSCCTSGGPKRPLARRVSSAAASVLPGAALVLLPKCPLCLAAWLTGATGIGISAAAMAWTREVVVGGWIAILMLAAVRIIRDRRFGVVRH